MKTGMGMVAVYVCIVGIILIGEIKCVVNAFSCNWEPIGKAEILYTGAAFTPIGWIVGYINIEDK